MSECVEIARPGGGGGDLQLWRRVVAAESGVSLRTAGPPARSSAPLPVGTSDPTDWHPNRIWLDGSQWVLLRMFLNIATLNADKTARVQLVGYPGDAKVSGISILTADFTVASATGFDTTFEPGSGKEASGWYEVNSGAYVAGLGKYVSQNDAGSAVQQMLTYVPTLDCSVLTARITALSSGIAEARLYGMPCGRPRGVSTSDL